MIRSRLIKASAAVAALSAAVWGIWAFASVPKSSAGGVKDDFTEFNTEFWTKTDGYSNGDMFNCTWRGNNISFAGDGLLTLSLTSTSPGEFDGAEYRSLEKYSYGKYEIRMKPAANPGVVSSFSLIPAPRKASLGTKSTLNFWVKIPGRYS